MVKERVRTRKKGFYFKVETKIFLVFKKTCFSSTGYGEKAQKRMQKKGSNS
jgi:hypothetical protein